MNRNVKLVKCSNSDYVKLARSITEFNSSHLPPHSSDNMSVLGFVLNISPWGLLGGITARIILGNCLDIEILWVDAKYRNQGYGTQLLLALEEAAIAKGSRLSQVDTYDFQALGFYQKHGYEIFGVLEDSPLVGHRRYYLKKDLRNLNRP